MRNRIVYISYDGLTDPLGESQILSYLFYNSNRNNCAIYSFEKPALKEDIPRIETLCKEHYISWHHLWYSKNPPVLSTLKDLFVGYRTIAKNEDSKDIVCHARSYMSALIALYQKRFHKVPFIFDMRGWWVDENIENGMFAPFIYRPVVSYLRRVERQLITESDSIVTATQCAKDILIDRFHTDPDKITVIPTCVYFSNFNYSKADRINTRMKLGIPEDAFVMIYNGSIGGYYNIDEMLKVFYCLKEKIPDAYFLFVTRQDPNLVLSKVNEDFTDSIIITSCRYHEMSEYLSVGDLGLILYDDVFSSTGRCPTKLAEYWAMGLPVICPRGLGNLDSLFSDGIGGTQFELENADSYREAVSQILETSYDKESIIRKSHKYFDSEDGANEYNKIYDRLLLKDS